MNKARWTRTRTKRPPLEQPVLAVVRGEQRVLMLTTYDEVDFNGNAINVVGWHCLAKDDSLCEDQIEDVTHWMPLPPLPSRP